MEVDARCKNLYKTLTPTREHHHGRGTKRPSIQNDLAGSHWLAAATLVLDDAHMNEMVIVIDMKP